MRLSRFAGVSFGEIGEVLREEWRKFFTLLMYFKAFAPAWPARFVAGVILGTIPPLLRIGRMVGLASFFACGAIAASAQTQPNLENGFKDYGSIHGSNIDSVNLTTG